MPNLDAYGHSHVESIDGRRARRDRNRDAVVDALLQCYDNGELNPNVADIAERCGISHRSVFRYFDDLDELSRLAIARGHERWDPMSKIHEIGKGPLPIRIERIVSQRNALFQAMEGPARAARVAATTRPSVQSDLIRIRLLLRAQLAKQFAPELKAMDSTEASWVLASMDVLCSFESFSLLRHDQNMTMDNVGCTMTKALTRLLIPAG